jgi:hypothetical protein
MLNDLCTYIAMRRSIRHIGCYDGRADLNSITTRLYAYTAWFCTAIALDSLWAVGLIRMHLEETLTLSRDETPQSLKVQQKITPMHKALVISGRPISVCRKLKFQFLIDPVKLFSVDH